MEVEHDRIMGNGLTNIAYMTAGGLCESYVDDCHDFAFLVQPLSDYSAVRVETCLIAVSTLGRQRTITLAELLIGPSVGYI